MRFKGLPRKKEHCRTSLLIAVISWLCFVFCIGTIQAQELTITASAWETIYRMHCLRCHGSMGDGRGPDSSSLMVIPKDFHAPESTAKSEADLRAIVIWGLVFSPMHGWWDRLSAEEIRAVISYIRQIAPYQPNI